VSPPKCERRAGTRRRETKMNRREPNLESEFPQAPSSSCRHTELFTEKMPAGYIHHARVVCAQCRKVLKWLAKPATIEHRRLNSYRLAKLAMCDRLTRWEQSFVENVSQRKTLSPRQQRVVDRLVAEYLEGAV
jgi:hypothetical protein